jgi:hypothetical protein
MNRLAHPLFEIKQFNILSKVLARIVWGAVWATQSMKNIIVTRKAGSLGFSGESRCFAFIG